MARYSHATVERDRELAAKLVIPTALPSVPVSGAGSA
jgi:hypothetical protein